MFIKAPAEGSSVLLCRLSPHCHQFLQRANLVMLPPCPSFKWDKSSETRKKKKLSFSRFEQSVSSLALCSQLSTYM